MDQGPVVNVSRRAFMLRTEKTVPNVSLTERCFAAAGVFCESCRDTCETGALRFVPQRGMVPRPTFTPDLCTQCGECAQVCPRDAISIRSLELTHV